MVLHFSPVKLKTFRSWVVSNKKRKGNKEHCCLMVFAISNLVLLTNSITIVPGFIQMESRGGIGQYPDVSCCDALKLSIMSKDDYAGYRVAFGTERSKTGFFAMGHKGNIDDVPVGEFGDVIIPFNMFSVEWDEATGDQIVTCAEDPSVCPSESVLQNMETISIWGEGVGGKIELQVKSISAVGCSGDGEIQFTTTGEDIPPRTNEAIKEWKTENDALSNESSSSMNMIPLLVGLCSLVSTLFLLSD